MTTPSQYSASIRRLLGDDGDYQYFLENLPDELVCGAFSAERQDVLYRQAYLCLLNGADLDVVLAEICKAVNLAGGIAQVVFENVPTIMESQP